MRLFCLCIIAIVVAYVAAGVTRGINVPYRTITIKPGCEGHFPGYSWDVKPGCQQCRCEGAQAVCYTCNNVYEKVGDLSLSFPRCCPNFMAMRNPWQALFDQVVY